MSWNHRVVMKTYESSVDGEVREEYGIYEVYYDDDGNVSTLTKNPIPLVGESLADLRWVNEKIAEAIDKPVLNHKDIVNE